MTNHWRTVDADAGIHMGGYEFGGNPINTVVIALGDERLLVVGPGIDTPDEAFQQLDALGQVVAIVSPGPFHHMGMPGWQARYPDAKLFCSASGCERIPKQHKDTPLTVHGLAELQPLLPSHVRVVEVPGMKHADVHIVVDGSDGQRTWLTNEIISNSPELPKAAMLRFMFKITGSGPGLAVNKPAMLLVGAKRAQVGDFYRSELDAHPPTRLIPSHGDVMEGPQVATALRGLVDARL